MASIPRRPDGLSLLPLSYAQQRFWFLTQVSGANTAFNVAEYHRLRGAIDVAALERALNEIARRHSSLRTTFAVHDGVPVQQIAPALQVPLPIDDLSAVPAGNREHRLREELSRELRKPWSLHAGPLFRAQLWRLDETTHQLLVLMHHIVSDGWSQGVLVKELASLYDAFSHGRPSPLPDPPIEYADFAVWQHEWMRSADFTRQLDYWKGVLQEVPVLQLPQTRGVDNGVDGVHKWFFLSPELTQGLRDLCRREGATLYMVILAAFTSLLARYSAQDEVVVGSPIANRDRPELEGLIGSFMNPLPIRVDAAGNPTFQELVRRARHSALGAFANQNVPFDVLVRTCHGRREATSTPLFQAMFLLQNVGLQSLQLSDGNLSAKAYASADSVTPPADSEHPGDLMYPLALQLYEVGPVIGGCVEYAHGYAAFMRQFPDHLRTLLGEAVVRPETRLSDLPVVTPAERRQLLVEWNHASRPRPAATVHRLFEAEAAAHPERTAVIANGVSVSYQALNARANAIARALRARGVGPEARVGILIDRSADMVASVLGVLKAGGAYVPLDAAYPAARLRHIAKDSAVRALVTTRALGDRVAELEAAGELFSVVTLDDLPSADAGVNVDGGASPANLAYVIYTSGSTGLPKGTMVSHASLANAFKQWEDTYRLRDLRVHLQMASLSFDVCTGDLCRALCSGGTLVIAPQEVLFAPSALYTLMERHRVEAAEFVPVVLRDLIAHVEATGASLSFLKLLVAGSDSWFTHEYEHISRIAGPSCRVVNSYGLTEATIDSTYYDGSPAAGGGDGLVPLGRAFANTELLVLDRHLQLVPVGIPGELCVAGIALARGYHHRADLTAERFVPHPFSTVPGQRIYRTGDLARYRPDGTLELLGRVDNQVKLRGFRIELSEVEAVLRTHDAVLEACAVIREDRPGDRRLVAYVVLEDAAVTASELRRFLRDAVPEYMVPSALVPLASLPLTPNGKIDRAALPVPDATRQVDETFVSPRTAMERRLAEIWRGVLNLDQIGVTDNFFDLGGHSLLLIQLHARIVAALAVDLTVLDLFRFPTIGALAAHISEVSSTPAPMVSAMSRADRRRAVNRLRRQPPVRRVRNTA
jgi:amino acid adenylation domain-containing protein